MQTVWFQNRLPVTITLSHLLLVNSSLLENVFLVFDIKNILILDKFINILLILLSPSHTSVFLPIHQDFKRDLRENQ